MGGALTVSGNAACAGAIYSDAGIVAANGYGFYIKNAGGANVRLISLTNEDKAAVGHTSYPLGLYGSAITSNRSITVGSDRRLKHGIAPLDARHRRLFDALTPVAYRYNDRPDREHMGLIYQDVKAALSDCGLLDSALAAEGTDGVGGIAYSELIGLLVQEVQTLKARVEALERGD